MKNDYNGWTNKETWNINLIYTEIFANMAEEQEYDDVERMANSFEALVDGLEFEPLEKLNSNECGLAQQVVGEYLNRVNWKEIAGHYYQAPEEESEEDIKGLQELLAEAE
jgi:hypothetical protein